MAILQPDPHEHSKSGKHLVSNALAKIGSRIADGVGWLFQTRVPLSLQKQGLTQEAFDEIAMEFYAAVRDSLASTQEQIKTTSSSPLKDVFFANGFAADSDRREVILDLLIDERGLRGNPEIVAFLKNALTPLPGGASWQ